MGRAPSMLGCSLVRINFGGARLARYSNLDARCSLDTRRAFFRPQIGQFWANSWLNLGKIMELFNTKKFSYIFGWKSAQNRPILGPFLSKSKTNWKLKIFWKILWCIYNGCNARYSLSVRTLMLELAWYSNFSKKRCSSSLGVRTFWCSPIPICR